MRKSIYYLIANTISLIAAVIVIALNGNNYPVYGFNLEVTTLKNAWEPIKYVALVEALVIIFTTHDVVSAIDHKKDHSDVPFTSLKNIIMAIVTVLTILYTWVSVILEYDDYSTGNLISAPYYFISFFLIGVAMMIVSKFISKLSDGISATLVLSAVLLMVSGVLYEFFEYWYCLLPCLLVTGLVLLIPLAVKLITHLRSKKHA